MAPVIEISRCDGWPGQDREMTWKKLLGHWPDGSEEGESESCKP